MISKDIILTKIVDGSFSGHGIHCSE